MNQTVAPAGSSLDEHDSPGEATVQVLRGRARLTAGRCPGKAVRLIFWSCRTPGMRCTSSAVPPSPASPSPTAPTRFTCAPLHRQFWLVDFRSWLPSVSSLKERGRVNGVLVGFWLPAGVRDWRLLF